MAYSQEIVIHSIPAIPEIRPGDDLASILVEAICRSGITPTPGDVLVVAHKVVSKAEGRVVALDTVTPRAKALELGATLNKNPQKIEVIMRESAEILRAIRHPGHGEGILICRHKSGYIMANAGVDESNAPDRGSVILLPEDPDRSAAGIRRAVEGKFCRPVGVVITDTFGRPWRKGLVDVAVGLSGPPPIVSLAGTPDRYGRPLRVTAPAFADQIAAAAGLLMDKAGGHPAVLIKGLQWQESEDSVKALFRADDEDLFR